MVRTPMSSQWFLKIAITIAPPAQEEKVGMGVEIEQAPKWALPLMKVKEEMMKKVQETTTP